MKAGDVIVDNDPRMNGRRLTIDHLGANGGYVYACNGYRRALFRIRADRIHTDGKERRSGYRLIPAGPDA